MYGFCMWDLLIELYLGWNVGGFDDDVLCEFVEVGKFVYIVKLELNLL